MLASLYHAHHRNYLEDIPYWQALAAQLGGPVLELGCGSGRVLLALAEAQVSVYGLDTDSDILAILQQRMQDRNLSNVEVHQADMMDFRIEVDFSLIILPCNTYSTLTSSQRQATLKTVYSHLAPGGVFAVSIFNPLRMAKLEEVGESEMEETFLHPNSGNPVQVSSAWRRDEDQLKILWHYDHLLPDGKVERATASAQHHLAKVTDYQQELDQAGYEIKHVFGDFERAPYQPESPYYIFTASPRS